jgi:hypothetical protein
MRQPRKNLRPDTQRYAGLQEVTLRRLYKDAGGKPTTSMARSRVRGRRQRGRKWPVVWLLLYLFLCSASASELP